MPTNFTGLPGTAEAPSPAPGPGVAPIVALPADSDPPNAATFAQAYKILANFVAWLTDVIMPAGTAFLTKLRRYRSMRGHVRTVIDHWGKIGGSLYYWTEQWTPGTPFDISTGAPINAAVGRWHILTAGGTASQTSRSNPGVSAGVNASNSAAAIQLTVDGASSGNRGEVRLNDDSGTSVFNDDCLITLEMEITVHTVTSINWVVGFSSPGEVVNAINDGAFFIRPSGAGTNWHARTIVGGTPTDVDTGVLGSADTPHTFAIHLVGANVDDLSAGRALFFIDGVQVANITTTLPINLAIQMFPLFGGTVTGTTGNQVMLCGPIRYSQITAISSP